MLCFMTVRPAIGVDSFVQNDGRTDGRTDGRKNWAILIGALQGSKDWKDICWQNFQYVSSNTVIQGLQQGDCVCVYRVHRSRQICSGSTQRSLETKAEVMFASQRNFYELVIIFFFCVELRFCCFWCCDGCWDPGSLSNEGHKAWGLTPDNRYQRETVITDNAGNKPESRDIKNWVACTQQL
jgi:hypothetical protein